MMLALLPMACDAGSRDRLRVEVLTDLVPGIEFDEARLEVDGIASTRATLERGWYARDLISSPLRLDADLPAGEHLVVVSLRSAGEEALSVRLRVVVEGLTGVPVSLLRQCLGVECDADAPNASVRCASPRAA